MKKQFSLQVGINLFQSQEIKLIVSISPIATPSQTPLRSPNAKANHFSIKKKSK
jgi:hypothetical protein